jgi:hypothetical protein
MVKNSPVHIQMEAEWVPEPVWSLWRRENVLALPGFEQLFFGHPAGSLVTILPTLFYLN